MLGTLEFTGSEQWDPFNFLKSVAVTFFSQIELYPLRNFSHTSHTQANEGYNYRNVLFVCLSVIQLMETTLLNLVNFARYLSCL